MFAICFEKSKQICGMLNPRMLFFVVLKRPGPLGSVRKFENCITHFEKIIAFFSNCLLENQSEFRTSTR